MAQRDVTFSPAEFRQLPLDYVIAAPLKAAVDAQMASAESKLNFIKVLSEMEQQKFTQSVAKVSVDDGNATKDTSTKEANVSPLALVDPPGLNIDSLSVEFDYEINQVFEEEKEKQFSIGADAKGGILGGIINIGISGSFSSKKSTDYSINKSGSMSIKLHASEAGPSYGLQKVINWMVQGIEEKTA